MATDFSVVFAGSQHFGDHESLYEKEDSSVEFVGQAHDYSFDAPGADSGAEAVLMFRSYGVSFRSNVLQLNGATLSGGIPPSVEKEWQAQVQVVPAGTLKRGANALHIETRTRSGDVEGNLDDFLLASMVVLYRAAKA